jgi:hypothetical protein
MTTDQSRAAAGSGGGIAIGRGAAFGYIPAACAAQR